MISGGPARVCDKLLNWKIYLQRKEKDKEYDALINKYRTIRIEMEIERKEKEMQITKKLKNALRKKNRSLPNTKRNRRI